MSVVDELLLALLLWFGVGTLVALLVLCGLIAWHGRPAARRRRTEWQASHAALQESWMAPEHDPPKESLLPGEQTIP